MFSPPRFLSLDISGRQHHPANLAASFGRLGFISNCIQNLMQGHMQLSLNPKLFAARNWQRKSQFLEITDILHTK